MYLVYNKYTEETEHASDIQTVEQIAKNMLVCNSEDGAGDETIIVYKEIGTVHGEISIKFNMNLTEEGD